MIDENQKSEYFSLLDNPNEGENAIQDYLEKHSYLLPKRFLLNHGIHFNMFISKLPIGIGYKTDFTYITKSSSEWRIVLVEIEDPKKKFFTKNEQTSQDFNHACDQISKWRAYINGAGQSHVREELSKLLEPLHNNPVKFKYLLIYGRTSEFSGNDKKVGLIKEREQDGFEIITYDSLISQCENEAHSSSYIILSLMDINKFKIKFLPSGLINTSIFSYVTRDYLEMNEQQEEILIKSGYKIDEWKQGELLSINHKFSLRNLNTSLKNN